MEYDGRIRVPFVIKGNRCFPMIKNGRVICVLECDKENEIKNGAVDCDVEKTSDGRYYAKVPVKFQMEIERMRS